MSAIGALLMSLLRSLFGNMVSDFMKKYAKEIIITVIAVAVCVALFMWYNKKLEEQYKAGYTAATLELTKKHETEKLIMQGEYEKLVKAAEDKSQKLAGDLRVAEEQALKNRQQADKYKQKWQETLDHVPLTQAATDRPFTVGFVGMFNLAVKGGPASPDASASGQGGSGGQHQFTVSEISEASGIDFGSATPDLAQSVDLTVKDLLLVDQHNLSVANMCLAERKQMKEFIDKVCAAGLCK